MDARQEMAYDTVVEMLDVMDKLKDVSGLSAVDGARRRTLLRNISDDALLETISRAYLIDEIDHTLESLRSVKAQLKITGTSLERISGRL